MTFSGGTTAPLPAFNEAELHKIFSAACPGEVHVVVAPPGVGKSVTLRQIVAAQYRASHLTRVLWATHSMRDADSLGDEAKAHFDTLGTPASIVYSRDDLKAQGRAAEYAPQFDWTDPSATPVKVISHTRVGQIFGPLGHQAQALRNAQLLVIDEEPFASLSLHASASDDAPLTLNKLARAGTSPVIQALRQVAGAAEASGTPQPFTDVQGNVTGHHLSGRSFWQAFIAKHPGPVDPAVLTTVLKKAEVAQAAFVAECFAEDAEFARTHPSDPRVRFGLDWQGKKLDTACLRFDLLLPLTLELPVLILDGYAEQAHYDALFPRQKVTLHHFDPGPPLQVECFPFTVHEAREGKFFRGLDQGQRRKQIAEEIALRAQEGKTAKPNRRMLVLSSKRLESDTSEWTKYLTDALAERGLALEKDVSTAHWHAGRGKNAYAGHDVFAVHPPYLNRRHQEFTLAALYPLLSQAVQRETATQRLIAAEALQMLHRGRQTRYTGTDRPRVIIGDNLNKARERLAPLQAQVELSEYQPRLCFQSLIGKSGGKKGSNNPRWVDGMTPLVEDLLKLFPEGLPRSLVDALPKHGGVRSSTPQVRAALKELTRSLPNTTLYRAFHTPRTWSHSDIDPGGHGDNYALQEALMERCGFEKVIVPGRRKGSVVYVRPGKDPVTALTHFQEKMKAAGVTCDVR